MTIEDNEKRIDKIKDQMTVIAQNIYQKIQILKGLKKEQKDLVGKITDLANDELQDVESKTDLQNKLDQMNEEAADLIRRAIKRLKSL